MTELVNDIIENLLHSKVIVDPFEPMDDIDSISKYYSEGMRNLVRNSVINPDIIPNLLIEPITMLISNFDEGVDSSFALTYLNLIYTGKVYEDVRMTFLPHLREILHIKNRDIFDGISPYRAAKVASNAIDIFNKKVKELSSQEEIGRFYKPLLASQELEMSTGFLLFSDDPVETAQSLDKYQFINSTEEITVLLEIFRNIVGLDEASKSYVSTYAENPSLKAIDTSMNLYSRDLTLRLRGPRSESIKKKHISSYTGGSRVRLDNSAYRAFNALYENGDDDYTISERKAEQIILFIEKNIEELQSKL